MAGPKKRRNPMKPAKTQPVGWQASPGLPEIIGIKEISANMTKFNDTMDALSCY
jgi:hypothetical protein